MRDHDLQLNPQAEGHQNDWLAHMIGQGEGGGDGYSSIFATLPLQWGLRPLTACRIGDNCRMALHTGWAYGSVPATQQ